MADRKYTYLSDEDIDVIKKWHASLDRNRGHRAILRRAARVEDVLLTEAFFGFLTELSKASPKWRAKRRLYQSALLAGLLSHVKQHIPSKSFATQLATPKQDSTRAPVSALRFQNLQKSRTQNDFYRNMLSAIKLLDGKLNLLSMADDVLHWMDEYEHGSSADPQKRLAVNWANDYYLTLAK
ncbi:MAG: type I-E CRISPR-associated protein Cse2/CasB [Exilibacterium sp.]